MITKNLLKRKGKHRKTTRNMQFGNILLQAAHINVIPFTFLT